MISIGIGLYGSGLTLAQRIAALFANGEQGAWHDPSDLSTLFQDSVGTTPGVVGQPIGLMLDRHKNDNVITDYSLTEFEGNGAATISFSSGTITMTAALNTDGIKDSTVYAISNTYAYCDITVSGTGSITVFAGGNPVVITLSATPTNYRCATGNNQSAWLIFRGSAGGTTGTITINKVAENIGNHAIQATAAARPVLDNTGGYNYPFFDGIDDSLASAAGGGGTTGFFFCQAIKPTGGAGTVRTIWSDTGTNTGYKVQLDAANKLSFSAGNGTAFTTLASTATVDVGTVSLITVYDDGTNLNVQIGSGTIESVARPVVSAGTAGFTSGKDNGAATSFFTGNLYPEVYRKDSGLTAAQRANVQAYCRNKAGL